ncbi:hypothetical protein ACA910_011071 [Epithemia clementina (nom. ined.)]
MSDIKSLTSFFSVPKGDSDIQMVYNGTKSGLNTALFAPWFSLASVDTMLRLVDEDTWSADNNFGEMFLNFWLHPELRKYAGIDLQGRKGNQVLYDSLWSLWNSSHQKLSLQMDGSMKLSSPVTSCELLHQRPLLKL